jgi:hypothetical protein
MRMESSRREERRAGPSAVSGVVLGEQRAHGVEARVFAHVVEEGDDRIWDARVGAVFEGDDGLDLPLGVLLVRRLLALESTSMSSATNCSCGTSERSILIGQLTACALRRNSFTGSTAVSGLGDVLEDELLLLAVGDGRVDGEVEARQQRAPGLVGGDLAEVLDGGEAVGAHRPLVEHALGVLLKRLLSAPRSRYALEKIEESHLCAGPILQDRAARTSSAEAQPPSVNSLALAGQRGHQLVDAVDDAPELLVLTLMRCCVLPLTSEQSALRSARWASAKAWASVEVVRRSPCEQDRGAWRASTGRPRRRRGRAPREAAQHHAPACWVNAPGMGIMRARYSCRRG